MKYGGMNGKICDETWESLLTTANNDFVSVLVLWYSGVGLGSTYAWMLPHTLEKYLKAYLLKSGSITNADLRKFGKTGHGLKEIWEKYKSISTSTTTKPKLNQSFDEIIDDLDTITPKLRYSGFISFSSDSLLYFYIVLCCLLRYLIVGKTKYRSSFYGLGDHYFLPMNYHPMSDAYGKIIVHKMLHLTLEHAGCFTNMGFVNQMDFDELSISNTAIFEKLPDCPICNRSKIDQLTLIKFYRDICPRPIQEDAASESK